MRRRWKTTQIKEKGPHPTNSTSSCHHQMLHLLKNRYHATQTMTSISCTTAAKKPTTVVGSIEQVRGKREPQSLSVKSQAQNLWELIQAGSRERWSTKHCHVCEAEAGYPMSHFYLLLSASFRLSAALYFSRSPYIIDQWCALFFEFLRYQKNIFIWRSCSNYTRSEETFERAKKPPQYWIPSARVYHIRDLTL